MLLIDCPWCGRRDEIEYRCGGQSHIARPPETVDDATWGRYLAERENPRGVHLERWLHVHGCRRWFNVARDTATHEIVHVYRMDEAAPSIPSSGSSPTGVSL